MQRTQRLKIASFVLPRIGGVYSVAKTLRDGLNAVEVDLIWLAVGPRGAAVWNSDESASERRFGSLIAENEHDDQQQAELTLNHIAKEGFDVVLFDVLGGALQANLARYLPSSITKIMIVHNITPGTYAYAEAIRDYVHATIGVSPRIQEDLIRYYKFKRGRTHTITNGIELKRYSDIAEKQLSKRLRVLFLGRIEDYAKGVFDIPKIASHLPAGSAELTIIGAGPDLAELTRRATSEGLSMNFRDAISPEEVPRELRKHDVLLFPSRFEGLGLVLIEAMAAGCVPVASQINGVTDFIIEHEVNGFLFDTGNVKQAADILNKLAKNPTVRERVGNTARACVATKFSAESMCSAYLQLIHNLIRDPPKIFASMAIAEWKYPRQLKGGLRTFLPRPLKAVARAVIERIRAIERR